MPIPGKQRGPGACASCGNPDVVHRDRATGSTQFLDHLAEYLGDLPVDGQSLHHRQRQKLVQFLKVLPSPRSLRETGALLADNIHRNADPFGPVENADNLRLTALKVAISYRIEAVTAHFQNSGSISSKLCMAERNS